MDVRRADLAHLRPGLGLEFLGLASVQKHLPAGGSLVPVLLKLPLFSVLLPPLCLGFFHHLLMPLHVCLHDGVGICSRLRRFGRHPLALSEDFLIKLVALHVERILPALSTVRILLLPLLFHPILCMTDDVLVLVLVIWVLGVVVRLDEDLEGLGCFFQLALVGMNQDGELPVLLCDLRVGGLWADLQHLVGRAIPLLRVVPRGGQPLDNLLR
mmetsp:Transcript_6600/g.20046  ORF Transcript_6600/g.20046 Transcript_6600/m.20046 type:complete len:213 (-) Transcript_6600:145-783(-)